MGALRDRTIEEMKLRNFSAATQKTYVYAVRRPAKYYGKAPDQISREEIRAFLVDLIGERKLSPNGLTGYCLGLRFFYNETAMWMSSHRDARPLMFITSPTEERLAAMRGAASNQ